VFDIDSGSLKFAFGSAGEGNGQFGAPTGVAVDRQGNILVADWGNSRIQVSRTFFVCSCASCYMREKNISLHFVAVNVCGVLSFAFSSLPAVCPS